MGSSLGATLMSLWGWVSEGSRTGPQGWGGALWDGAGPKARWGQGPEDGPHRMNEGGTEPL